MIIHYSMTICLYQKISLTCRTDCAHMSTVSADSRALKSGFRMIMPSSAKNLKRKRQQQQYNLKSRAIEGTQTQKKKYTRTNNSDLLCSTSVEDLTNELGRHFKKPDHELRLANCEVIGRRSKARYNCDGFDRIKQTWLPCWT